ncbi:hypothetical protein DERF_003704 [Dermatophagoides farinae]|uniref:Uncharacterized protein n=1 Tax=Dermatophagoides farinae TaxID=6954 RepID=A0A922IGX1_DERFA|nr:hypothetical protein DERF_003704 [Dermatophagoides farinae]
MMIDNNDDDEDGNGNDDNNNEKQNSDSNQNVVSESNESLKKENCQTKYAYLDNVKHVDLNGLISMSDDLRSNVEILKNSYLAIVNSLVILNERRRQQRRRRRRQQQRKTSSQIRQQSSSNKTRRSVEKQESVQQQQQQSRRKLSDQEIYNDSEVMMIKMNNNNNNKIDNNYNLIGENFSSTKKQTTTMEWNIEKFCDPKTREKEFQWLFDQVYITLLCENNNNNNNTVSLLNPSSLMNPTRIKSTQNPMLIDTMITSDISNNQFTSFNNNEKLSVLFDDGQNISKLITSSSTKKPLYVRKPKLGFGNFHYSNNNNEIDINDDIDSDIDDGYDVFNEEDYDEMIDGNYENQEFKNLNHTTNHITIDNHDDDDDDGNQSFVENFLDQNLLFDLDYLTKVPKIDRILIVGDPEKLPTIDNYQLMMQQQASTHNNLDFFGCYCDHPYYTNNHDSDNNSIQQHNNEISLPQNHHRQQQQQQQHNNDNNIGMNCQYFVNVLVKL